MEIAASFLTTALLAIYYLVLGVLALYGLHRLHLVWVWLRTRGREVPTPPDPPEWPVVTVQLPLYNELYVAERLIDAVCRLDYPADRLEIQVLDDSTDETRRVVADAVRRHRERGVRIEHLHRTDRTGFKAGALEAGTGSAGGELLAVFDADFVPPPDFLRRTVPHFQDPGLGMVQARWQHLNRRYSLLTRIQAMLLDGHFAIEHTARHRGGCFFNFNGTAGIWRREAIEDAGGWDHDTLTEDLDLSYRAQLAGWRFLYLPDLGVPSELPVDADGFKSQQHRWARGSIQTGRKLLATILRAPLPFRVKVEAFVHLTNNMTYPLMVLLSILVFPAMVARQDSGLGEILMIDLPLFLGATVSVLIFYVASQAALGVDWRRRLWHLPALMGLGIGLSISNARAALGGLWRMGGTFVRTPKYRIEDRLEERSGNAGEDGRGRPVDRDGPRAPRYRAVKNLSWVAEGLFALYFVAATVLAVRWEMYLSLPFLWLFLQGYTYMFFLSLGSAFGRIGGTGRLRPA
ncbi:MAG: glycosyltransferase family 2 protein [Acidobacteriota bacterium]|jgi:cellulose synthase/poly-beta-1,6-N-acetylglucosamine synthase-like glycosyltransferase